MQTMFGQIVKAMNDLNAMRTEFRLPQIVKSNIFGNVVVGGTVNVIK